MGSAWGCLLWFVGLGWVPCFALALALGRGGRRRVALSRGLLVLVLAGGAYAAGLVWVLTTVYGCDPAVIEFAPR